MRKVILKIKSVLIEKWSYLILLFSKLWANLSYLVKSKTIPFLVAIFLFALLAWNPKEYVIPFVKDNTDLITAFSLILPAILTIALIGNEWRNSLEKKLIVHFRMKNSEGGKYIMSGYNINVLENADLRTLGIQVGAQISANTKLSFNPSVYPIRNSIISIINEKGQKQWVRFFEIEFLLKDPFEDGENKEKYLVSYFANGEENKIIFPERPNIHFEQKFKNELGINNLLSSDSSSISKYNLIKKSIQNIDKKIPKIYLLNSSVITASGQYSYHIINKETAKEYIKTAKEIEMAISYESTAKLLSQLLEIETYTNRNAIQMQTNEAAIILKPKKRLEEIKTLTIEELEKVGYELGWLVKVG